MKHFFTIVVSLFFLSCTPSKKADIVIYNGSIYTMDDEKPQVEAIAIRGNEIFEVGSWEEIKQYKDEKTKVLDLKGQTMIPGLIDAHVHLMGIGYHQMNVNLLGVESYEKMVSMVKEAAEKSKPGEWIVGRGWHQSKWDSVPEGAVNGLPVHDALSAVSPNNPVFLRHASGHAGIANHMAMEKAGIYDKLKEGVSEVSGGEIIMNSLGQPTGMFNENAMSLIKKVIPKSTPAKNRRALKLGIQECLANGITSVHDAGIGQSNIDLYKDFINEGLLDLRVWAYARRR